MERRCVKKALFCWAGSKCLVAAAVWSGSFRSHRLQKLFGHAGTLQTTNVHHQSTFQMADIFFFLIVEQKVVVTCSWPAMRVKSSNWSSATSWQQNDPLIIIKRGHIRFIGPYRIFSKLLLNSKHQAAATKSSCVSFLRLEAKCFTV